LFVSALSNAIDRGNNNWLRINQIKTRLIHVYTGCFLRALAGFVAGISGLGGGVVNVPVFIYILV